MIPYEQALGDSGEEEPSGRTRFKDHVEGKENA